MLDLVEGGCVVSTGGGLLIRYQFFDLASPVDYDGLQALNLVLFLGGCLDVMEVLVRDVQLSAADALVAGLSQSAHELV